MCDSPTLDRLRVLLDLLNEHPLANSDHPIYQASKDSSPFVAPDKLVISQAAQEPEKKTAKRSHKDISTESGPRKFNIGNPRRCGAGKELAEKIRPGQYRVPCNYCTNRMLKDNTWVCHLVLSEDSKDTACYECMIEGRAEKCEQLPTEALADKAEGVHAICQMIRAQGGGVDEQDLARFVEHYEARKLEYLSVAGATAPRPRRKKTAAELELDPALFDASLLKYTSQEEMLLRVGQQLQGLRRDLQQKWAEAEAAGVAAGDGEEA